MYTRGLLWLLSVSGSTMGCLVKCVALLVVVIFGAHGNVNQQLTCQEGWSRSGLSCFRLFPLQRPADIAAVICQSYGSQLLRIKDFVQNKTAIEILAHEARTTELWLVYSGSKIHGDDVTTTPSLPGHQVPLSASWAPLSVPVHLGVDQFNSQPGHNGSALAPEHDAFAEGNIVDIVDVNAEEEDYAAEVQYLTPEEASAASKDKALSEVQKPNPEGGEAEKQTAAAADTLHQQRKTPSSIKAATTRTNNGTEQAGPGTEPAGGDTHGPPAPTGIDQDGLIGNRLPDRGAGRAEAGGTEDWPAPGTGEEGDEACVLAVLLTGGRAVWGFAPCHRPAAFVCHRYAAPADSFHCSNGRFVDKSFACDGEDDCGDESDETNCKSQCSHHLKDLAGEITLPDLTKRGLGPARCRWLLEAPAGSNVRLDITDFATDPEDVLTVLAGGMGVSSSRQVARLSGSAQPQSFVSFNHFLLVEFSFMSGNVDVLDFRATFETLTDGPQSSHRLLAVDSAQELLSPFYPRYVSQQYYSWTISAEETHNIITLQIVDSDLKGDDSVIIRDGSSVYSPSLLTLSSLSNGNANHVQNTGLQMFISMHTRSFQTGRGFHFKYWQGCHIKLEEPTGFLVSPGYLLQKPVVAPNQTCLYDVTVPDKVTVTLIFSTTDIDPRDVLQVEEAGRVLFRVKGPEATAPTDVTSGAFRLTFRSNPRTSGSGFALAYSLGCPRLRVNSQTAVQPASIVHPFGSKVTLNCSSGYAFSPRDLSPEARVPERKITLECLYGGVWSLPRIPQCQALCTPGWYFDETTQACEQCPVGQYQSDVNMTSCSRCPSGTTTEGSQTTSVGGCKQKCAAGQYFSHGAGQCQVCPLGTHQSRQGQFQCHKCPEFKTTAMVGATSEAQCSVSILDSETKQEIQDEGLVLVRMIHLHVHHRHRHRQEGKKSPPGLLLEPGAAEDGLVFGRAKDDKEKSTFLRDRSLGTETRAAQPKRRDRSAGLDPVLDPPSEEPFPVLLLSGATDDDVLDREKRSHAEDGEDLECSGGSGYLHDLCEALKPCNDTQHCQQMWDGSLKCQCLPIYFENEHGDCVDFPSTHKLYLSTPLEKRYSEDLASPSSGGYSSFWNSTRDALNAKFEHLDACHAVQILNVSGKSGDVITEVLYELLFKVEVGEALLEQVARTVYAMDARKIIQIGAENITIASYTGIFRSLLPDGKTPANDSVNWCNITNLSNCSVNEVCVDSGLRFTCQGASSTVAISRTTPPPNDKNDAGAVAGGVVGGVAAAAVVVVVAVILIRKRKQQRSEGGHALSLNPTYTQELLNTQGYDKIEVKDGDEHVYNTPDDKEMAEPIIHETREVPLSTFRAIIKPVGPNLPPTDNVYESTLPESNNDHVYTDLLQHRDQSAVLQKRDALSTYAGMTGPRDSHPYASFPANTENPYDTPKGLDVDPQAGGAQREMFELQRRQQPPSPDEDDAYQQATPRPESDYEISVTDGKTPVHRP